MRARALAALHRVERDGGVHAKRERLIKVGAVHDAKVKAMRHALKQLAKRALRRVCGHAERAGEVVAGPQRDDAQPRATRLPYLHEAVHNLMNHTVATKREHRVKAGGRARHLRGDARTGREAHVKAIRRRPVGGKRATHELGSLGARAALRGGVGDDERMSKVKRHATSLPRRP